MRTEDGHIIYKCLNGDTAAFGLLVDKYKGSIYALAYSKLHNFHDAEDITQETFLKAYQKLRTLRWWDNFLTWLYAIASNLCKQWIRSQSKRPDREFAADQSQQVVSRNSMDSYGEDAARESLQEALESISESYRQVLTLYYLGGMNSIEIARFLGTSPNNIAQRLRRARAKLKVEMTIEMGEAAKQHKLPVTFTFRVMEIVERMKIQAMPRMPWLSWGMSALAGTVLTILCFVSFIAFFTPVYTNLATPGGVKVRLPSQLSAGIPISENIPVSLMSNIEGFQFPTSELPGESLDGEKYSRGTQTERRPIAVAKPKIISDVPKALFISGKVVKSNAPVPNAQVHIYVGANLRQELLTRVDGAFFTEIPGSENGSRKHILLTANATHPRRSFGWTRLPRTNAADLVIRLHEPMSVAGAILNEGLLTSRQNSIRKPEFHNSEEFSLSLLDPVGDGMPESNYGFYRTELAMPIAMWPVKGRKYLRITEVWTDRGINMELLKGGFLAFGVPDQVPDEPILPSYIINPYRSRSRRDAWFIDPSNYDDQRASSFLSTTDVPQIHASRPTGYELVRNMKEDEGDIENSTFSHIDFQFQKGVTLIVTFGSNAFDSDGKLIAQKTLADRWEGAEEYNALAEGSRSRIIGLAPGQKFSLKAERGELHLRSNSDTKARPAAEVEILMEKDERARLSANRPIPSANVGLTMYLYMTPGN